MKRQTTENSELKINQNVNNEKKRLKLIEECNSAVCCNTGPNAGTSYPKSQIFYGTLPGSLQNDVLNNKDGEIAFTNGKQDSPPHLEMQAYISPSETDSTSWSGFVLSRKCNANTSSNVLKEDSETSHSDTDIESCEPPVIEAESPPIIEIEMPIMKKSSNIESLHPREAEVAHVREAETSPNTGTKPIIEAELLPLTGTQPIKAETSLVTVTQPIKVETSPLTEPLSIRKPEALPLTGTPLEQDLIITQTKEKVSHETFTYESENITSSLLNVTELVGHASTIFCVDADKDIVLTSSADTTVKVWDMNEKKEVSSFRGHTDVVTSAFLLSLAQSKVLASHLDCAKVEDIALSCSLDCHIRIWCLHQGNELKSIYTFNGLTCMSYMKDHLYAVVGTDGGKLQIWDLCSSKVIYTDKNAHEDCISDLQIDGDQIYSISWDGAVKVWTLDENELQPMYVRRRREPSANQIDFNPSHWNAMAVHNGTVYLGDNTSTLKVLNFATARLRLLKNQTEVEGKVRAVLVKDNILFTSFFDSISGKGGINVWQLPEATYICTLNGKVGEICSLAVTVADKKTLRIVSGGNKLLVWDFDFSKPPLPNKEFYVSELEDIGNESENPKATSSSKEAVPRKRSWCHIM